MENMNKEERDFLLWRYLHQDLSVAEKSQVQQKLDTSKEWMLVYQELVVEEQLFENLETEETSLRFSRNVMEAIAQEPIAPSTRSYINTKLMKWIGIGMVGTVLVFLAYTLSIIPWEAKNNTSSTIPIKLPTVSIDTSILNNTYLLYGAGLVMFFCAFLFFSKLRDLRHKWY